MMEAWSELIALARKRPALAIGIILFFICGSGMSIGAIATKGMLDEKHNQAMDEIRFLKRDRTSQQRQLDRMESKIDSISLIIQGGRR